MTIASLDDRADTGAVEQQQPNPGARARRRTFTAEYKARILDEYDAVWCPVFTTGRRTGPT